MLPCGESLNLKAFVVGWKVSSGLLWLILRGLANTGRCDNPQGETQEQNLESLHPLKDHQNPSYTMPKNAI
jgi:hypothetical protein